MEDPVNPTGKEFLDKLKTDDPAKYAEYVREARSLQQVTRSIPTVHQNTETMISRSNARKDAYENSLNIVRSRVTREEQEARSAKARKTLQQTSHLRKPTSKPKRTAGSGLPRRINLLEDLPNIRPEPMGLPFNWSDSSARRPETRDGGGGH